MRGLVTRRCCARRARLLATASSSPAAPPPPHHTLSRPSTTPRPSPSPSPSAPLLCDYWATCSPGLEAVVAAELSSPRVGAVRVTPGRAGVRFSGDERVGYSAVLWLRSAVRVLRRLASSPLVQQPGKRGADAVYEFVKTCAPWAELLPRGGTFSVDARVWSCDDLSSDALAATRAKDAICDALREAGRSKPEPPRDGETASLPLFLSAFRDEAVLYRDLCGASLHKRGYRSGLPIHKAALSEAVAAGVLSLANFPGSPAGLHESPPMAGEEAVLVDPMCGSGTILIEAALMAGAVAPGLLRPSAAWPFTSWPDHDRAAWADARGAAASVGEDTRRAAPPPLLLGCDSHDGAVQLARACAAAAGVARLVRVEHGDVRTWAPRLPHRARVTHVVSNPPWGGRLQGDDGGGFGGGFGGAAAGAGAAGGDAPPDTVEETWFQAGQFMKRHCGGASAALLCGNKAAAAKLFVSSPVRHPITVGGVDCRLLMFTLLPPRERGVAGREGEGVS